MFLQSCYKLSWLNIEKTRIDSGLEYLPTSLADFRCQGTKLEAEVKLYNNILSVNAIDSLKTW